MSDESDKNKICHQIIEGDDFLVPLLIVSQVITEVLLHV